MIQIWRIIGMVIVCFMLVGGISPVIANSIYGYTFNQHLWATTIDTNFDGDIEYDVDMPEGADYNLYVWDTWGENWYYSKADGNTDYILAPQHKGYQHYLYLYAYKGEGKWVLSCDDIDWVPGSIEDLGEYYPSEVQDLLDSNPDYPDDYY